MIGTAALVGALLVALGVALGLARVLRRLMGPLGSTASPISGTERLLRAIPASLAAALAFVAAARIAADASYEIGGGISLVFVALGVASTMTAITLVKSGLSKPTPFVAALIAVVCAVLLVASSPIALARSACACTTPATAYMAPTLLGMDATTWAILSAVGSPVLLLIALFRRA